MWRSAFVLTLALMASIGCQGSSQTPAPGAGYGGWPELEKFSMDTIMIVGQDASMGNWRAVQRGVASEPFQKGVEQFAAAPVPAGKESLKPQKEKVDSALQKLTADAKLNASPQTIETSWKEVRSSLDELITAAR